MPNTPDKISASSLQSQKQRGQKISMLTAYDYPTAMLQDEAGIDVGFVGDSVGTNVLGYRSPQQVTMEDILHHLRRINIILLLQLIQDHLWIHPKACMLQKYHQRI